MAIVNLKVRIKLAWWFTYLYVPVTLFLLVFISKYINMDIEFNDKSYSYWFDKALKYIIFYDENMGE